MGSDMDIAPRQDKASRLNFLLLMWIVRILIDCQSLVTQAPRGTRHGGLGIERLNGRVYLYLNNTSYADLYRHSLLENEQFLDYMK
jgi:hypothetical protein